MYCKTREIFVSGRRNLYQTMQLVERTILKVFVGVGVGEKAENIEVVVLKNPA